MSIAKMTVFTVASLAEESAWGAASLELSGPPTAPLLGQLEHDTASLLRVEQDGRPGGTLGGLLQLNF